MCVVDLLIRFQAAKVLIFYQLGVESTYSKRRTPFSFFPLSFFCASTATFGKAGIKEMSWIPRSWVVQIILILIKNCELCIMN